MSVSRMAVDLKPHQNLRIFDRVWYVTEPLTLDGYNDPRFTDEKNITMQITHRADTMDNLIQVIHQQPAEDGRWFEPTRTTLLCEVVVTDMILMDMEQKHGPSAVKDFIISMAKTRRRWNRQRWSRIVGEDKSYAIL